MADAQGKGVMLFGATGSIGDNTLQVLRGAGGRLRLAGAAAQRNWRGLAEVAREFRPPAVALGDPAAAAAARASGAFPAGCRVLAGPEGLCELAAAAEAEIVLMAISGTAGLRPTLAALGAGRTVALASKEVLVLAGRWVTAAARAAGRPLLPVDSEHNAIFQCLRGAEGPREVARLLLTASGGPFREWSAERLAAARPADALRHPTWAMGRKITVDSATMANKGLELIEAHWLFGLPEDRLDVVVHPQSVVHSMVEFVDGAVLAQLSPPSMTFAISYALFYPERWPGVQPSLDFTRPRRLDFEPPDAARFPCLGLARAALRAGGAAPAVFNAANEVAVEAFLAERLPFPGIPATIEATLAELAGHPAEALDDVLAADAAARACAARRITDSAR